MKIILKYFPDLSDTQINQFEQLKMLYQDWVILLSLFSIIHAFNAYTVLIFSILLCAV